MNIVRRSPYIGITLLASLVTARASGPGTSGGNVLGIGVGARAIAMGEAYTAQADDVSSLYWNPAGIALLNQSQASFMYNQWLNDLSYHNAAVAVPLENGGLGASVSYLSYGSIQGFDSGGNPTGDIDAYNGVGTVGGAWLGNMWSAGFNLKGIQGSLADEKATGFATDFGASIIYPKEVKGGTLRAAAAYRNLGSGLKYIDQSDPLPREWRVGLAVVQLMNRRLNLSMDYGKERGIEGNVFGGLEYWALPYVALRTGFAGDRAEGNGFRAGLGLKFKDLSFDYAYGSYGDLGITHRYELSLRFGYIRPILTAEMRRLLRQARLAMAQGRYGEATMLLDSLIRMEPRYRLFHRLVKTAMAGYEGQEEMAKGRYNIDTSLLHAQKARAEDKYELQDLEMLLKMSDDSWARINQGNLQPSPAKEGKEGIQP